MTAFVDTRWRGHHGIARYATEILRRLPAVHHLPDTRIKPASALDPWWLRHQLRKRRARLFFTPGFNAAASETKQLLVLHDLIHLHVPEESSRLKQVYYERLVRPAVLRTGSVVTVSEFSKRQIVEWCGMDPEGVTVAPGAISEAFRRPWHRRTDPAGVMNQAPYVMYVGNGKPHKNVALLSEALRLLPDLHLVCIGLSPNDFPDASSTTFDRMTLLHEVPDEDLAVLYRHAECLAFPSRYEGFGLPAVEALSQGTSVAYRSEAVAETVGDDCGIRAWSDDPEEFAECITRAIHLKDHPGFAERATGQASRFDWDRSARQIAALLGRLDA